MAIIQLSKRLICIIILYNIFAMFISRFNILHRQDSFNFILNFLKINNIIFKSSELFLSFLITISSVVLFFNFASLALIIIFKKGIFRYKRLVFITVWGDLTRPAFPFYNNQLYSTKSWKKKVKILKNTLFISRASLKIFKKISPASRALSRILRKNSFFSKGFQI